MSHKIRGFIAKAGRAGVNRVFIGLESINPDALKEARKGQNQITEYRAMLQAWHRVGTLTYAGYILGFPGDTPASIERDIRIIQRELSIDLLEFFILTPLPGSADHKKLHLAGVEMARDLNKYDLVHVTTRHPVMSDDELRAVYRKAWDIYYSPEHVERVVRRSKAWGYDPRNMLTEAVDFPRRPAHRARASAGRRAISAQVSPRPPAGNAARKSIRVLSPVRSGNRVQALALRSNGLATLAHSSPRRTRLESLHGRSDDARAGHRIRARCRCIRLRRPPSLPSRSCAAARVRMRWVQASFNSSHRTSPPQASRPYRMTINTVD